MTPGYLKCEISHRPAWKSFYVGLGINAALLLLLVAADPQLRTKELPEQAITSHYVTLVSPFTRPSAVPAPVRTPVKPRVAMPELPKAVPPSHPVEARRIEAPKPSKVEIAKSQPPREVAAAVVPPKPPALARQVKTNVFDSEKSHLPVVHEAARKVQTGGFGDPNGLAGEGDPKRQALTAANVGSFDLPAGSGKGNGTAGSHGVSGQIRTAGFGDVSPKPVLEARNENVAASGFGDVVSGTRMMDQRQVVMKPQVQPVQILYKPIPAYTPEARRRGVQGEVLLDVVFEASGALHINRVVKGLGYGLDDMALAAAKKIQFRPALRDGQPYDCAALVHIRFELAE